MRNYKADTPENTIKRIKTILNNYGINTDCMIFGKEGVSYSARISIQFSDHNLNIGTNGKGLTKEYAIASAYGELMERLCNKALIFATKYSCKQFLKHNSDLKDLEPLNLAFRYFPDEQYKTISAEELLSWTEELLPNSFFAQNPFQNEWFDMPFLPFKDYFKQTTRYLPYDMLRLAAGSTGLCAGNTKEEAILQGINEIFERYVLQRIYIDQPRLPSIRLEAFSDSEIGKRIQLLQEQTKWRFIIKDCSLGKGFPVMGLMIIDDIQGKFTFRLGADLSDEIALQRCFTEIFQGNNIDTSAFLPITISENLNITKEYENNVINGRGLFPESIFIDDAEIYENSLKPVSGNNIEECLTNVLDWLRQHNYNLYVRDNSFMNFPVYHLYIPGLSDISNSLSDISTHLLGKDEHYKIKEEFRLKRICKDEARSIVNKYRYDNKTVVRLFDYSLSPYNTVNRNLILSMLSYFIGEDKDAHSFMSAFLESKESNGQGLSSYYYCVKDMFLLKYKKYKIEDIVKILCTLYGQSIANEVCTDLQNRDRILMNFPIPDCFNCNTCNMKQHCDYESIVKFESFLQYIQKQYQVTGTRPFLGKM